MGVCEAYRYMARPPKAAGEKQEEEIRVKCTPAAKEEFIRAAAEDGMDEVSIWVKWLMKRRMRQQERERGIGWAPRRSRPSSS